MALTSPSVKSLGRIDRRKRMPSLSKMTRPLEPIFRNMQSMVSIGRRSKLGHARYQKYECPKSHISDQLIATLQYTSGTDVAVQNMGECLVRKLILGIGKKAGGHFAIRVFRRNSRRSEAGDKQIQISQAVACRDRVEVSAVPDDISV